MTALEIANTIFKNKLRLNTITTVESAYGIASVILWSINEAQRELNKAHDWLFMKHEGFITLVADQKYYAMPESFNRPLKDGYYYEIIDGTSINDKPIITIVSDKSFREHTAVNTTPGLPYIARLFGSARVGGGGGVSPYVYQQIEVYSVPDSSTAGKYVYFEYIKNVTDFVNDTDTSMFDDLLLIEGGYLKYKVSQGNAKESDFRSFISTSVMEMRNNDNRRSRKLIYKDI